MGLVLNADREGIFRRLAGSRFQTDRVMKLNRCSSKAFHLRIRGCMKFDMCRANLKGKRGVYFQSDGMQKCYVVLTQEFYRQPMQFI